MIKSPCKGCHNELVPKKICIKKCKKIHNLQHFSADRIDELSTSKDEVFENRILIADNYECSVNVYT